MTAERRSGPSRGPLPQTLLFNGSDPMNLVVARLRSMGKKVVGKGTQRVARCPAHKDRTPSLSIGRGRDGRVLLCCHAGCKGDDILRALNLDWKDLFAPKPWPGVRRSK